MENNENFVNRGPKEAILHDKLEESFNPSQLIILNESYKHKGHQGFGAESHFHVTIEAEVFKGKSTLACHRLIFDVLRVELDQNNPGSIHALSLTIIK